MRFDDSILRSFVAIFCMVFVIWVALIFESCGMSTGLWQIGALIYTLSPIMSAIIYFESPSVPECKIFLFYFVYYQD